MFGIQAYTSPQTAVVEMAVRLLSDKTGEVRATRVFRTAIPVTGTSNAAYVKALDKAFDQTVNEDRKLDDFNPLERFRLKRNRWDRAKNVASSSTL